MLSSLLNIFKSGSNDKPKPTQSNVSPVTPRNVSPAEEAVNHADRLGNVNKSAAVTSPKQPEPTVFDGNVASFPTFWKRFRVVHKSDVSDTRKLISLKAYLGSPKLLEDIDGQSYADAVKTLFSKYQYDPDVEYGKLFDELLKIKLENDTVFAAQKAVSNMEAVMVKMDDLGEDMEDPALRTAYICRLPKRYQTTFEGTFADVRKHVAALVEADARKQTVVNSVKPVIASPATLTNPSQNVYEPDGVCVFCQQHPYSNDCTVIPGCNRRLKYLEGVNRCYRCLGLGHEPNHCKNVVNCQFCTKRSHHMAVCWQNPRFTTFTPNWATKQSGPKRSSKATPMSDSTKEITAPLKSPVLIALYDQLQAITLSEQRLVPSYDVYTKMEQILTQMAAVNQDLECADLRKLYLDRIPRWMHQKFSKTDSLEQIRNAVKKEFDVCMKQREREIQSHRKPKVSSTVAAPTKTKNEAEPANTAPIAVAAKKKIPVATVPATLAVTTSTSDAPKAVSIANACIFCSGKHAPSDCTDVRDYEKRMSSVTGKGLCFICLGNHLASACDVSVKCRLCQRAHHDSLCWNSPNIDPKSVKIRSSPAKSASPVTAEKPAIPDDAASVTSKSAEGSFDLDIKCIFCAKHDYSSRCPNVTDLQQRITIVERMGRCTNCLFQHSKKDKRCLRKRCHFCNEQHHGTLCSKNPSVKPSEVVVKDSTKSSGIVDASSTTKAPSQRSATPQPQNQHSTTNPQPQRPTKTPPHFLPLSISRQSPASSVANTPTKTNATMSSTTCHVSALWKFSNVVAAASSHTPPIHAMISGHVVTVG